MLLTISIILRAVRFRGMSSAYRAQSPPLSATWQSVQLSPSEAEKNPMVPMNRSTGIPLRIWTFLKTSSAMGACCRCAACPPATATVSPHAIDAVPSPTPIVRLTLRYPSLHGLSQRRRHCHKDDLSTSYLDASSAYFSPLNICCFGAVTLTSESSTPRDSTTLPACPANVTFSPASRSVLFQPSRWMAFGLVSSRL